VIGRVETAIIPDQATLPEHALHPGKELVVGPAVVVHPDRDRKACGLVRRADEEYVRISVAVIRPSDVHRTRYRINSQRWKTVLPETAGG